MNATATAPILTSEKKALGYTQDEKSGAIVYNPIAMVFQDHERKSNAQKAENLVLTADNVKKLQERVGFLEGQMAKMYEEFQSFKARK